MLSDGLLEAVLLIDGALGQGEVAVGHVAGLGQQVGLAQRAVGRDHLRPVQGVTDPQVAGVLVQERAALGARAAQRPGRDTLGCQKPVHGRAMQLARADDLRSLEHADDPPDRAPRPLALDAQDLLGDLGRDRPAPAPVSAILGKQRLESTAAVGVVPDLDRAR